MKTNPQSLAQLTPKQRDVLALVADNRTSKEIAAILGISESAVNQRIEMVRARWGGLPRGELARIYRQECVPGSDEDVDQTTWQKMQLPESPFFDEETGAGSIASPVAGAVTRSRSGDSGGSQLTALPFASGDSWLWRDNRATAFVRIAAISALVATGLAVAFAVTQIVAPVG